MQFSRIPAMMYLHSRRCLSVLWLLCLLLCLSHLPHESSAMIDTNVDLSCSSDDSFFAAWSFEFAAGGSYTLISLTLKPSDSWLVRNNTVQVMLATDSQLDNIRSASMDDVCANFPFNYSPVMKNWVMGTGYDNPVRWAIPDILSKDWYRLLVLNCAGDSFDMVYSDVAVNPGGEYLSLSEVPYKPLFSTFLWIWLAAIGVWSVHVFLYRYFNIGIQSAMLLLPLSKCALCIPSLMYWQSASKNGVYPQGLAWAVLLTATAERVIWFGIAYLLASGWRVTKHALHPLEHRGLSIILCLLALSYFIYELFGGFLIFVLLVAYVLALRVIFAAIVENGNALLRQNHMLSRNDIDVDQTPLADKMRMFKSLQVSLLLYVSVDVIFQLWAAIFLKNTPWVGDCAENTLSFLVCVALAWAFRMRPFNPYWLAIMSALIARGPAGEMGAEGVPSVRASAAGAAARSSAPPRPSSSSRRTIQNGEYQNLPEEGGSNSSSGAVAMNSVVVESAEDGGACERRGAVHLQPKHGGSGCCAIRSVGADQLWHPFCEVPPLEECQPELEHWGGGEAARELAAARRQGQEQPQQQPILVLEADGQSDQPPLIGTLMQPEGELKDASVEGARLWGSLPAAALPYLPASVRSQLAAQERMWAQDSRGVSAPSARQPSSGSSRSARSRRSDDFPDYI
jgi:hypothetical protein